MSVDRERIAKEFEGLHDKEGVTVWRIINFDLAPAEANGSFFEGDSYLVLHTFKVVVEDVEEIKRNIHFWQGSQTTQDESGSVAIFATLLDELFGGAPVQFREQQGDESPEFKQLFPQLRYSKGGAASGFKHVVADAPRPSELGAPMPGGVAGLRMLQVKSPQKGQMQVFEVPAAAESLGTGDAFVVEHAAGGTVYIWQGPGTNMREKMECMKVAESLRGNSRPLKVVVLETSCTEDEVSREFYQLLGAQGAPQRVKTAAAAAAAAMLQDQSPQGLAAAQEALEKAATGEAAESAPSAAEELSQQVPRLFRMRVASGGGTKGANGASGVMWDEIDGTLSRSLLTSDAQYGLVAGGCIWIWSGSRVLPSAVAAAVTLGSKLRTQLELPDEIVVKAMRERAEPGLFTSFFKDWEA